jgi:NitT/TauT family transport system substrate-binding protein
MSEAELSRRSFAASLALVAIQATGRASAASSPLERSKVVIAAGGKGSLYQLPLTIADQLGFFRAEGLDVELLGFESGPAAMQAASRGAVDVVSGAYEHTLLLQSRGQRYLAFALQGRAPGISMGVSPRTLPHYRAVADLKGRTIGVSAPGSSTSMVANLVLSRAGLDTGDVNFVDVGMSDGALAAFRAGHIDAMSNVDPVMTILEQRGEIRMIADTRTLKGTVALCGGPMPAACLYASGDFIAKNPNTVQAITYAMAHSLKWLQTAGPLDIIKTVPEAYLRGDRASYLAAFNKVRQAISTDGLLPDDALRNALRVLASFDPAVRPESLTLAATYTNEFAKKAKARFKA